LQFASSKEIAMQHIAQRPSQIHRHHRSPTAPEDGTPRTPIGRRLIQRFRFSPSVADAIGALAGFSTEGAR
jgi:hypothetical protein